jgi:hypothetical protein
MAALRSDIERALDDLISNEDGMKFQGLAVVLAKKRWPDLVASERKKDLGADAIAKAPFAVDGVGKVLACSTTATLKKIRDDAKEIKEHFKDISQLVFATPATIHEKFVEPLEPHMSACLHTKASARRFRPQAKADPPRPARPPKSY